MRILLCTDGSPHAQAALRFGASLARVSPEVSTLLGVIEHQADREQVERALEEGRAWLSVGLEPRIKIREGHAGEEIVDEAASGEYDLLVVGTRGRRAITRFLLGTTAHRIARHAAVPVLLVQGKRDAVKRILVCTAGGEPGLAAVRVGGRVARLVGAQVTVLHVMSQLPAAPVLPHAGMLKVMPQTPAPSEPPSGALADLYASAEQLMRSGTREGVHLSEALAILDGLGVRAEVRVRHGLVIDEILAEIHERDHSLIVVGTRPIEGWMRFLLNDVSQQIIGCTDRPILVVRA